MCWNSLFGFGTTTRWSGSSSRVIRKAELTSATWDTIWKIFLWSMDVMLGVAFAKMGRCGLRLRRCKCWRKVGSEVLNVTRNNANHNMCWLCIASTRIQDLLYTGATNRATVRTHESRAHELREQREQVPVWMERSALCWEHVMIDVLHCVDQAVMSRVVANALLRGHEFWPQGDLAARADPACERRSAPVVRSESRRPLHPKHALSGPSANQCRHP